MKIISDIDSIQNITLTQIRMRVRNFICYAADDASNRLPKLLRPGSASEISVLDPETDPDSQDPKILGIPNPDPAQDPAFIMQKW
jgi:hypothetical protein